MAEWTVQHAAHCHDRRRGKPVAGAHLLFDATQSSDVKGTIRSFRWDFGGGKKGQARG